MAVTHTTTHAPFGAVSVYRLVSLVGEGVMAVYHWNVAHRMRRDLNALTDHQLHDIGLERADIDAVADRALAKR